MGSLKFPRIPSFSHLFLNAMISDFCIFVQVSYFEYMVSISILLISTSFLKLLNRLFDKQNINKMLIICLCVLTTSNVDLMPG